MKILYDEISRRFPEVRSSFSEGDEELPYLVMGHLASWLKTLPKEALTPELIARLVSFTKWCEEQPRGKDACDDLFTMLSVSFYEELFDTDTMRELLPRFISRAQFVATADYFRAWVGTDNYDKALRCYDHVA
jgi:hypothetical protein